MTERSGTLGLEAAASSNPSVEPAEPSASVGVLNVVAVAPLEAANIAPLATVRPPTPAPPEPSTSVPADTDTGPANAIGAESVRRPLPALTSEPLPETAPAITTEPVRSKASVAPEATAISPASEPADPPLPIWRVPADTVVPPVKSLSVATTARPVPVFASRPAPVIRPGPVNV